MKIVARPLLFVASMLIGVGCAIQSPTAESTTSAPTSTISTSSATTPKEADDAGLRTACATRVLVELIRAFNAGDVQALERTIGSGPLGDQRFQWVSFHDALRRDAEYTADGARRMLLERWSQGQRLTLVSATSSAGPNWDGGVGAAVRLESRAPALSGPAPISGKAALSCVSARIYVLSIGDE